MSQLKNIDCQSNAEQYTFNPVYYAGFAFKKLPSAFTEVYVGPTTSVNPMIYDCVANGWPSTRTQITLSRVDDCQYAWYWTNGNAYLELATQTEPPYVTGSPDMPDLTVAMALGNFWDVLDGQSLAGSTSYNFTTNETTFVLTGNVVNSAGCIMPFEIYYNGV